MVTAKCINKRYDAKGNVTHYTLQDIHGNKLTFMAEKVKTCILEGRLNCVNLELTASGQLIDRIVKPNSVNKNVDQSADVALGRAKAMGINPFRFENGLYHICGADVLLEKCLVRDGEFTIPAFCTGIIFEDCNDVVTSTAFEDCVRLKLKNKSKMRNFSCLFSNCMNLVAVDLHEFDASLATDMSYMFNGCDKLSSVNMQGVDTSKVIDMTSMFDYCLSLTSLSHNMNTSSVTSMKRMFADCRSLTSLDLRSFNTGRVRSMSFMFAECEKLAKLDLRSFSTESLKTMQCMLSGCTSLVDLNLGNLGTAFMSSVSVTNIFRQCTSLKNLCVNAHGSTVSRVRERLPDEVKANINIRHGIS